MGLEVEENQVCKSETVFHLSKQAHCLCSLSNDLTISRPGEGSTEAVATTTEGSAAKEEQEAEEFKGLVMTFIMLLTTRAFTLFQVNIMLRLTNSGHLPANLTKEDFEKRIVRIFMICSSL